MITRRGHVQHGYVSVILAKVVSVRLIREYIHIVNIHTWTWKFSSFASLFGILTSAQSVHYVLKMFSLSKSSVSSMEKQADA